MLAAIASKLVSSAGLGSGAFGAAAAVPQLWQGLAIRSAHIDAGNNTQVADSHPIVRYKAYTDTAAVTFNPVPCKFQRTSSGRELLDRAGYVRIEAASANSRDHQVAQGKGRYNWQEKFILNLDATELALISDWNPTDGPVKFLRGGFITTPKYTQLQVRDAKTVTLAHNKSGLVNMIMEDRRNQPHRKVQINLTRAQLKALQILARYSVPMVMGFDAALISPQADYLTPPAPPAQNAGAGDSSTTAAEAEEPATENTHALGFETTPTPTPTPSASVVDPSQPRMYSTLPVVAEQGADTGTGMAHAAALLPPRYSRRRAPAPSSAA